MSGWSPPKFSRPIAAVVGVLCLVLLAYSLVVVQEFVVVGLLPAVAIASVYLLWRFLVAVEAIADALQRLANQREHDDNG